MTPQAQRRGSGDRDRPTVTGGTPRGTGETNQRLKQTEAAHTSTNPGQRWDATGARGFAGAPTPGATSASVASQRALRLRPEASGPRS